MKMTESARENLGNIFFPRVVFALLKSVQPGLDQVHAKPVVAGSGDEQNTAAGGDDKERRIRRVTEFVLGFLIAILATPMTTVALNDGDGACAGGALRVLGVHRRQGLSDGACDWNQRNRRPWESGGLHKPSVGFDQCLG
ncbi:hypothetical protein Droror1_Dr00011141 [Drosera rotundifolia]